jgi:hypothetical protein
VAVIAKVEKIAFLDEEGAVRPERDTDRVVLPVHVLSASLHRLLRVPAPTLPGVPAVEAIVAAVDAVVEAETDETLVVVEEEGVVVVERLVLRVWQASGPGDLELGVEGCEGRRRVYQRRCSLRKTEVKRKLGKEKDVRCMRSACKGSKPCQLVRIEPRES